jgi:hypothetical protein
MPRHEARIARLLDEEGAAPAQEVWADHAFDGVEDRRMPNQAVQPGEQEMALVPHRPLEPPCEASWASIFRRMSAASPSDITGIGA